MPRHDAKDRIQIFFRDEKIKFEFWPSAVDSTKSLGFESQTFFAADCKNSNSNCSILIFFFALCQAKKKKRSFA